MSRLTLIIVTFTVLFLFSNSRNVLAQQKDGDETSTESNRGSSTPSGKVNFTFNFANVTLLNGEFLEAFGANNSRGILRGHPTIPGTELGTTTADPLMFSTNSTERMRILANGFVGIGTSNPQDPLHLFSTTSIATMRLQGGNTYAGFIGMWDGAALLLLSNNRNPTGTNYNTTVPGSLVRLFGGDIDFGTTSAGTVGNYQELVRIKANGNVGIGTPTPAQKLDVQGGAINASGGLCIAGDCKTAWSQVGGGSQWITNGTSIVYNTGSVGIGTNSPLALLDVRNSDGMFYAGFGYGPNKETYLRAGSSTTGVLHLGDLNTTKTVLQEAGGNVGIGTATPNSQYKLDVAGNINSSGTITGNNIVAKYQDVAEWVESSQELSAGTVVVVDHTKSNQVITSSQSYDTRVAGVVSAQPGIALGEQAENKVLVATTGRVRIKVDATSNPIHVGDLLVTSDIPGVAMKSQPLHIGGVQIHRPGTLIGKALEPLAKGSGEILVLLSLQ